MYSKNRIDDIFRFVRASLTNQIVRLAPRLYIKLTGETGRGVENESVQQISDYFKTCFYEYFHMLGIKPEQIAGFLAGKRVLEYGPGNIPGIGLLMLAYGAERVTCVDKFHLYSLSTKSIEVLRCIISSLEGNIRRNAMDCFVEEGDPLLGFKDKYLKYIINPYGLSGLSNECDLIISRAVLEHVNNLPATFADIHNALCDDGITIHKVDLGSHGLHRGNCLEFLTWPTILWSYMYRHKGCVNRWRIDRYRESTYENGLKIEMIKPNKVANKHDIEEVRPYLARQFRNVSDEDLSWLDFWLVCRKVN